MSLKVGFVGAGKMATALARGFIRGGAVKNPKDVAASCPKQDAHLMKDISALGCLTGHCNQSLVKQSDIVIIATKPNIVDKVLSETRQLMTKDKLLVSIAAGITVEQLEEMLDASAGEHKKVIRLMPNTPCLVGEGASVFSVGQWATQSDADVVKHLMAAVGECHQVPEQLMDVATGISGSGPAYMYLIIEAMADGGVKQGLPRPLAYRLAAQTMVGAGKMVLQTEQHPAVLKDEVCSPGGTTITALDILEKSGLRTSLMQAVEAATKRCQELAEDVAK